MRIAESPVGPFREIKRLEPHLNGRRLGTYNAKANQPLEAGECASANASRMISWKAIKKECHTSNGQVIRLTFELQRELQIAETERDVPRSRVNAALSNFFFSPLSRLARGPDGVVHSGGNDHVLFQSQRKGAHTRPRQAPSRNIAVMAIERFGIILTGSDTGRGTSISCIRTG